MRSVLVLSLLLNGSSLLSQTQTPEADAQPPRAAEPEPDEDESLDQDTASLDPLAYTQTELQNRFNGGLALNLGPVMPWSEYGASLFWQKFGFIQSVSVGAGAFEFSNNYRGRNFKVKTNSQSLYYAGRWFFLGFGPLYLEPFAGFARWSGSIAPSGYDDANDTLASSLNSRFDITGLSVGGSLGLMWNFQNGFFIDYNLVNLSSAVFLTKSFTTNTEEARKNVRKELEGPLTMSNLHLRLGYGVDL